MRAFPVLTASFVVALVGVPEGCQCSCGAGGGGTRSTPALVNVSASPECDAVCKKIEACEATCDRDDRCKVERGKCAASRRALLTCEVDKGAITCLPGKGFTMASLCAEDEALCTGADADTTKLPE